MKRPVLVWLVFAACALIGLGVLGWFSTEMLRLERGAEEARVIAAREENVRLALWRMDSALASVHGLEAARLPEDYAPFHHHVTAFTQDLAPVAETAVMLPSPLLGYTPPFVRLHLQVDAGGAISSPQVPVGPAYLAALRARVPMDSISAAATRLQEFRTNVPVTAFTSTLVQQPLVDVQELRSDLRRRESTTEPADATPQAAAVMPQLAPQAERQAVEELKKNRAEQQQRVELVEGNYYNLNTPSQQRARAPVRTSLAPDDAVAAGEWEKADGSFAAADTAIAQGFSAPDFGRAQPTESTVAGRDAPSAISEAQRPSVAARKVEQGPASTAGAPGAVSAPIREYGRAEPEPVLDLAGELTAGPIQATWVGDELFLLRRVDGNNSTVAQAVWLDWPELRAWLLSRVTDLLPEAVLEAVPANSDFTVDDTSRRLAFLPVRLRPGVVPLADSSLQSPLQTSLAIAWALAGVGIVSLALLLAGTLRLSERRGAFVSAVTHELRTPLTTFRMYTEMLASGMVPDEARRLSYLDTLRKEAERLSHLVENVLSYARLERGRASQRIEDTTPGALLARIEERLRLRAEQGGLTLVIDFEPGGAELPLHIDTTAFEQIIFNLVDNAAKYARRPEGGGALAITVATGARERLVVRVRDNGPGIAASVRKRLFQPFSKSAAEAAHSQPGVGLGLALSRRLARDELHGELSLESTGPGGTVFRLEV